MCAMTYAHCLRALTPHEHRELDPTLLHRRRRAS